jgi:hypothetical protein
VKASRNSLYLAALCVIGLLIRLDLLFATQFTIDSDEAIVGLMAKHILEGKGIPCFYYGQHYMGSLEPLCAALFFKLFGMSNVVLKLVPLVWSISLIPLTFFLAKKLGTGKFAWFAAILITLPPSALVEWSSRARGGFIEIVVLGTLSFILTLDWLQNKRTKAKTFLIGLLLGLGWWTNNQTLFFMLPIGLFMLLRLITNWRAVIAHSLSGIAGFFIGSSPFWIYNLQNHFASFGMFESTKDVGKNFSGLFESALPIILGARRFWHTEDLFPYAPIIAYAAYGILLLIALLGSIKERRGGAWLLLLFVVTTPVIFSLSSFGYLVEAPRYLLPIYPALFAALVYGISTVSKKSVPLACVFFAGILSLNLASSYLGGLAVPGEPHIFEGERVSRDHTELIQWLDKNNVHWVRTNYWIGYRLAFETEEQIRFSVIGYPYRVRIPEYEDQAKQTPDFEKPFILTPKLGEYVKEGLRDFGYIFKEVSLSGYTVLYSIKPVESNLHPIPAADFTTSATLHNSESINAVDGNINTRWGSGTHQVPGMKFTAHFNSPRAIRAIEYDLGSWTTDFPRLLSIECLTSENSVKKLIDTETMRATRFFLELQGEESVLYFAPLQCKELTFEQRGSDPIFDWSIAELKFFE